MEWWPDWSGQTVVIAASGPSQRLSDVAACRGRARVIALNETWRMCPWADTLYACDATWWRARGPRVFAGLRIVGKGRHPGCHRIPVVTTSDLLWTGAAIGGGGNSGFQALNMAALWGARRVIFLGLDCRGAHWHRDHAGLEGNPTPQRQAQWVRCFTQAAPVLAARGIEVINASRETALECFRRAALEDVL